MDMEHYDERAKVRLSLDVSPELNDLLIDLARRTGGSKSEVLRNAIILMDVAVDANEHGAKVTIIDPNVHEGEPGHIKEIVGLMPNRYRSALREARPTRPMEAGYSTRESVGGSSIGQVTTAGPEWESRSQATDVAQEAIDPSWEQQTGAVDSAQQGRAGTAELVSPESISPMG